MQLILDLTEDKKQELFHIEPHQGLVLFLESCANGNLPLVNYLIESDVFGENSGIVNIGIQHAYHNNQKDVVNYLFSSPDVQDEITNDTKELYGKDFIVSFSKKTKLFH